MNADSITLQVEIAAKIVVDKRKGEGDNKEINQDKETFTAPVVVSLTLLQEINVLSVLRIKILIKRYKKR
jgi:hypothetical protein